MAHVFPKAAGESPRDDVSELGESPGASTLAHSDDGPFSAAPNQHRYEPILATDADVSQYKKDPVVTEIKLAPTDLSYEQARGRHDAGLLSRSRFHWSVMMPLDALLALSPIFFFGKRLSF